MAKAKPIADRAVYERLLATEQVRLLCIQQAYLRQGLRGVIVLEGTDAAGKGGAIKRLTERLDPRFAQVWPIGAPNDAERGRHWLERFWGRLPPPGQIAIFDRSWYGRVLVERAEALIPKHDWKRAYREIEVFERLLIDDGIRLVKLFLTVSEAVQAERLIERLRDPLKRWKISARDFEARKFATDYREAEADMLAKTEKSAPWHMIDGDLKWAARVAVARQVADALAKDVDLSPPALDPVLARLARTVLGVEIEAA